MEDIIKTDQTSIDDDEIEAELEELSKKEKR